MVLVGAPSKPLPVSEREVQNIIGQVEEGVERPKPTIRFDIGETVTSLRKVVPVRRVRKAPPGAAEALARMVEAYDEIKQMRV